MKIRSHFGNVQKLKKTHRGLNFFFFINNINFYIFSLVLLEHLRSPKVYSLDILLHSYLSNRQGADLEVLPLIPLLLLVTGAMKGG